MNNKILTLSLYFFIILLFDACGFKPIYSEKNYELNNDYYAVLNSNNSKEVKDIFNEFFKSKNKSNFYKIKVEINERSIPLLTNSDGTVSKYKIEIYAAFTLIELSSNELIYTNFTRGFNSYSTDSSEYNTEENKKIAIKQATREALQILISKIQNRITKISK